MKLRLSILFLGGALAVPVGAAENAAFKDQREKLSYGFGINVGNAWKRNQLELADLDIQTVFKGIQDALSGKQALLKEDEIREVMGAIQSDISTKREARRKALADKNKPISEAFLAANKTKSEINVLPSGLQYKVITEGNGPIPKLDDTVTVNYRGTLIDGTEFDSSYSRNQPSTFVVSGVIKGWQEALQRMKTGSKWQLFIPPDLAYGERGFGAKIEPNAALIFEIELLSVTPAQPTSSEPVTSDIIKVPSAEELKKGAQIEIIKADQIKEELKKQQEQQQKP